jgi:hypothetical protein
MGTTIPESILLWKIDRMNVNKFEHLAVTLIEGGESNRFIFVVFVV